MLGLSDESTWIDRVWCVADDSLELPGEIATRFFHCKGPTPICPENRRVHHRYFLRSRAILTFDKTVLGVYTTDLSRQGIGFLCTRQLLPKQTVRVAFPNRATYELEVARCRRTRFKYFDCGGKFSAANFLDKRDRGLST